MMRIIGFIVIFLTFSHGTQAAPGDVFDALVEKTQEARNTATVPYNACGEAGKKEFVASAAESWYLWNEELAQVSAEDFETAQAYLDAITAPLAPDGRDPGFSYLTTQAADDAQGSTGAYVGFGFSYGFDYQNRFLFSDVLQGGPAGDANFKRGNEVIAIDMGSGFETIDELSERQATIIEIFGGNEAGLERGFRVRQGQSVIEVTLTKRELVTPPLATEPLLLERAGNSPVGYLNLRSFIETANDALSDATRTFRDAGVTDLVIDLRYNGGGLVSVADRMLDLLGGLVATNQDSWSIIHNEKHSDEDFGAYFAEFPDSMAPLRIAFITTGSTASASELVINSLSPHIEVVLIGEDTLGKAVGQYAFDQNRWASEWTGCDTRLRLIAFQIVNGEGDGQYYNGLVSSGGFTLCPAIDDLTRDFGDPAESSLNAALGWLNNGFCSANTASVVTPRLRQLGSDLSGRSDWHVTQSADAPFGLSPWVQ